MDEDALKKVIKLYPHTRQADLAAFDLIDNKLCGDWQGEVQCPQKESEIYEKYADEHPDGPRTAQALYEAVYRQAVLRDMYAANGDDKKSEIAKNHAHDLAARLKDHFANQIMRGGPVRWCTNWMKAFLSTASTTSELASQILLRRHRNCALEAV